jgi:hypothetical protein
MTSGSMLRWSRFLQAAAAAVIALSAVLVLAPGIGGAIFNLVYFGQAGYPVPFPPEAGAYIRFSNGVLGSVMTGWMIAVIAIARGPFVEGRPWAWRTVAGSIEGWFLVDTVFSAVLGAWGNVALNTAMVLMFAAPLLATRRHFRGR